MMLELYLTPVSLGYLTQFILAVLIALYLVSRLRLSWDVPMALLAGFFVCMAVFAALMFLDSASMPTRRLEIVFVENIPLAAALIFFSQFVYRFPVPGFPRESRFMLVVSLLYLLVETLFSAYRFALLNSGVILYRENYLDYLLLVLLAWPVGVYARLFFKFLPVGQRAVIWHEFLHPSCHETHSLRDFVAVSFGGVGLGVLQVFNNFFWVSQALETAAFSVGILFLFFFLAYVSLRHSQGRYSFTVQLSGVSLLLILTLFGLSGWVIGPIYSAEYQPQLPERRSLRFMPNSGGGYDIHEIPFAFTDTRHLGAETLRLTEATPTSCSAAIDFQFPFYGRDYSQVYICNDGVLSLGHTPRYRDYQYRYGNGIPLIAPLLIDLHPEKSPGAALVWQDAEKLIATWDHMRGFARQDLEFTFQLVLYSNGVFDISYNGLPAPDHPDLLYQPNDEPGAIVWALGAVPGGVDEPQYVQLDHLPLRTGPNGVLQDFHREYRQHLHLLMAPLAWFLLFACLLVILVFPAFFYAELVRPLHRLLSSVHKMDDGNLSVSLVAEKNDEIGELAQSFSNLANWLRALVDSLEARVAERTHQLNETNHKLLAEARLLEAMQTELLDQNRQLAVTEEREKMSRDLHDSFGQLLAYINVQAQAAQALLEKSQPDAAQANLRLLIQATQSSHHELRQYILGLRNTPEISLDFYDTVREYLDAFGQSWGVLTTLSLPQGARREIPSPVEDQLLNILQEALVNIRKHAHATRADVVITSHDDDVTMMIGDDGCGFDQNRTPRFLKEHFGLGIMRERARQVGGVLEVRSASGQGTRIFVSVPLLTLFKSFPTDIKISGLRILLVDDQPLFLEGLQNLLLARGLTVIGLAHDGLQAFEQASTLRPDVVLMDVHMPRCNGVEATRLIKAEFPEIQVILLTVSENEDDILLALKYGASGYLLKSLDIEEIFAMLPQILRGELQMAPALASRLLREFNQQVTIHREQGEIFSPDPSELTERQWEVLRLVASGKTYKEVGFQLHLTERAIKYHMEQILARLQVDNRHEALEFARKFKDARSSKKS